MIKSNDELLWHETFMINITIQWVVVFQWDGSVWTSKFAPFSSKLSSIDVSKSHSLGKLQEWSTEWVWCWSSPNLEKLVLGRIARTAPFLTAYGTCCISDERTSFGDEQKDQVWFETPFNGIFSDCGDSDRNEDLWIWGSILALKLGLTRMQSSGDVRERK